MDATSLYITTCRYILNADLNNENSGGDLYRLLPYLRQSLSCCVCTKLLNGPMGPSNPTCQHHVCQGCIGGKKRLRPACGWCTDYSQFVEKKQLRILLLCYKKMCEYIADTPISRNLVGTNGGTSNVLALLYEGMAINVNGSEDTGNASYFDIIALLQSSKSNCVSTLTPKKRGRKKKVKLNSEAANTTNQQTEQSSSAVLNDCGTSPKTQEDVTTPGNQLPTSDDMCSSEDVEKTQLPSSDNNKQNGLSFRKNKYKRHSAPAGSLKFMNKKERGRGRRLRNFRGYRTKSESAITDNKTMRSAAINYAKTNRNLQKKLIISGRRAKLLREGRKLVIHQGCRCGTWSPGGGTSSTCQGRRCPCFMAEAGCEDCKCRGCSNPLNISKSKDDSSKGSSEIGDSSASGQTCSSRSRSNSQ
ncbi:uncharacterized protein [Antedon mediterranea]|uniref:uncharacterized protein n=1 Tax=Antedon mediterranea TaxID=105859 RepID=UPI003AF7EA0D